MANRTYRCVIQWHDRKWGPQMEKCAAEGTSIRRAIAHALLNFFSDSNRRRERRDAHAAVEVKCSRVKKPAAR